MKPLGHVAWMAAAVASAACLAPCADHNQYGQRHTRNQISDEKGLADDFKPGRRQSGTKEVLLDTARNVRWAARTGSETYGGPIVAGGRVYIGTNNSARLDDRHSGDRGVLLCLDEQTGKTLWRLFVPKLTSIRNADWWYVGLSSPPTVEGDRVYVVSNRGEVLCLDAKGQADGNDGPFTREAQFVAADGEGVAQRKDDADILWCYDMVAELNVSPHNASNGSVLIDGDLLYVCTSNGVEYTHTRVPSPEAPSLIVLDKRTGRLVARDDEKTGHGLAHGQWSSPSIGTVNGRKLVFHAAGNGICYAFEPVPAPPSSPSLSGPGSGVSSDRAEQPAGPSPPSKKPAWGCHRLKKVWQFAVYPDDPRPADGGPVPGGREKIHVIYGCPVLHEGKLYFAGTHDPWHSEREGKLVCVDPSGTGDITRSGLVWSYDMGRCVGNVSAADGLVYVGGEDGRVHCLEARTGKPHWVYDTRGPIWGGGLLADGKYYIGNGRRGFFIFRHGPRLELIRKIELLPGACNCPAAANGRLYVASQENLYCIERK